MMLRVLVISYYFPPCTGAPSWRPFSWAENFSKHGIKPFILTRNWSGDESTWDDFVKENKSPAQLKQTELFDVLHLPSKTYRFNLWMHRHKWLAGLCGNIYFFGLGALGRFNTEVDGRLSFQNQIIHQLKENTYDAVIVSSPPSNILELIPVIKKHSDAVVVADIRDLWNNMMLSVPYKPTFKQKIWDLFYSTYYKKWLKEVDLVTVIVEPFVNVMRRFTKAPVHIVYNGYESKMFASMRKERSTKFVFSIIGSLYPQQDLSILLDGLNEFIADKSSDLVNIRFIGATSLPEVSDIIVKSLPAEYLHISGRVNKSEALQETLNAHVLSYSGWKGVRGIISTKAFDYIASGNYVLIAPGDDDALDALVKESKCGSTANSTNEFVATLNELYATWLKTGDVFVEGDREKIIFYSREKQAEIMAGLIHEAVNKKSKA
jgi:hypothetical protein